MEETATTAEGSNLQPEKPEGEFMLTKREHIEWALGKIAALEAEERLIQAQAEKALKRIRSDRESFTGRFLPQIDSWTRGEIERTKSRRRSIVFLHGTVQFTSVAPRLVVESEADALTTAAAVVPGAVVEVPATVKLDKKALLDYAKAHFEDTGELLPGVGRTEASERFAIKFSEAESAGEATEAE